MQNEVNLINLGCLFCGVFLANRDGLLFELENGKPKLILLSAGESKTLIQLQELACWN